MMPYKTSKAMVRLPNDYTCFFEIVAGVLLEESLLWYLIIICLDYALQISIDLIKKNVLHKK